MHAVSLADRRLRRSEMDPNDEMDPNEVRAKASEVVQ
jgi:hypothetical protein